MSVIDQTAKCLDAMCRRDLEHVAGIPGSDWNTPYWRHVTTSNRPHAAVPDPDTIRDCERTPS